MLREQTWNEWQRLKPKVLQTKNNFQQTREELTKDKMELMNKITRMQNGFETIRYQMDSAIFVNNTFLQESSDLLPLGERINNLRNLLVGIKGTCSSLENLGGNG
ncbi:hypothetical protein [endosymbiont GvMRE of Glomus versiforme]|uniref:hypothetical protein n=1 Tax=endosymbiont GvMRE of Glomus versiforme TaxID=2039283 RepID=UPI000ECE01B3|nr:hypothetical protein [endosymbiont GvMRE of Glomus versiforme]RHZ36042.1 hypothetical protein GvMRE_Ic3g1 [endosymbiont GvMRE of Glomus versiforme]